MTRFLPRKCTWYIASLTIPNNRSCSFLSLVVRYTVTAGKGNPITYTEMDFMAPQPKIGEDGEIELKPNGKPDTTRGDDRLIVGSNGSIYYSPDHYHTFILIVE